MVNVNEFFGSFQRVMLIIQNGMQAIEKFLLEIGLLTKN
jgi:hypothetical protein